MKQDILQRIAAVLNALNNVSVAGKANITNMAGSISLLEEVAAMVERAEIADESRKDG